MQLSKKQVWSIKEATARINIWHGSVRASKTIGSIIRWHDYVEKVEPPPGSHLMMVGRTERSLAVNILDPMESMFGSRNFQYSTGKHKAFLYGKPIQLYGASDIRAEGKIRGLTSAGAYGDEMTIWPPGFFKMLMTRLSVDDSKFFGTTNPDNPKHEINADYIKKKGLDLKHFPFKLRDNPFLSEAYIANLEKEYTGLFYKRFILGEWCLAEGAIYDFFDESLHTGVKMPRPEYYLVGVDYGTKNPCSFGLYGVNRRARPMIWRIKGYYWDSQKEGRQKTDGEYSKDMKTFLGDIKPRAIIIDPSAASFKAQLKKDHKYFIKDADNDVFNGIRVFGQMMKNGLYMIQRHPSNQPHIDEIYGYLWDEKATADGQDKPLKEGDHTMDESRYVVYTTFGKAGLDYSQLNKR